MSRKKIAISLLAVLSAGACLPCFAQSNSTPPINASGAGMTSAQLEATRPILSAVKSVEESQQAVDQIKDRAKEMLDICTKTTPVSAPSDDIDGALTVHGPYSHVEGKYYVAPKWKLVKIKAEIDKQRSFLAETISQNQKDSRPLRSSDACREKIESLRAEARQLTVNMTQDANQISTLISQGADQNAIAESCKSLIKSTQNVEKKLKEMDKVLKHEIKE